MALYLSYRWFFLVFLACLTVTAFYRTVRVARHKGSWRDMQVIILMCISVGPPALFIYALDPTGREGILSIAAYETMLAWSLTSFMIASSLTLRLFMQVEARFNAATRRYITVLEHVTAVMPFAQMLTLVCLNWDYRMGEAIYIAVVLVQLYFLVGLSVGACTLAP
jgi:hypothetical protein